MQSTASREKSSSSSMLMDEHHTTMFNYLLLLTLKKSTQFQGCALRKITGSPKTPNHEILGGQHLNFIQKESFSSHLKTKVSQLQHLCTLRAQPWLFKPTSPKNLYPFSIPSPSPSSILLHSGACRTLIMEQGMWCVQRRA